MSAVRIGRQIPVVMSEALRDGEVVLATDGTLDHRTLFIGTRPLTDLEMAGEQARHIVRRGLADVIAWLGESVGPEPQREGRGRALLEQLRTIPEPDSPKEEP